MTISAILLIPDIPPPEELFSISCAIPLPFKAENGP
jgi:hypothetical protein